MTGNEIRLAFLKYFEERKHTVVSSSGLIPHADPTLLFANAGMNQFKDIFLGRVTPPYLRAASCQKVVRAGGKHNDLENVGRTARHHTFFEMLGNFSFGDYFKKDAITFSWDFLTNTLGIPADKLFVSVYKDDDEAFGLWRDMIGLPEDKIHRRGEKDNFWQMGDTGPCGPCSEIHIDQGVGTGCGHPDCNPDCECDRHLELWNLVFMQFNRDAQGNLTKLPMPSIDTGMGLERVTAVVQQVKSNYDTDLVLPIIDYIGKLAHLEYGEDPANDVSMRVIADHARAAAFLISDGVLPSNEGRGYVLRRVMRRAMRHGNNLGLEQIFFHRVCSFVVDFMKFHYAELGDKQAFVERVVMAEEEAFSRTLNTGMKMIREEILDKTPAGQTISGETIFKFYDTYGFPVDLMKDVLEDAGYKMDMDGYNKYMAGQQEKAKKAGLGGGPKEVPNVILKLGSINKSDFVGYTSLRAKGSVLAIIQNNEVCLSATEGDLEIITDITPFYPEGGGQSGDSGTINFPHGAMQVDTTYRVGSAIVHKGWLAGGGVMLRDSAVMMVDEPNRRQTQRNHTATHLLHKALQIVLGDHIRQAGSQVNHCGFRFDFTHFAPLTRDEINKIVQMMNDIVEGSHPVTAKIKPLEEAIREGAKALFGEKYNSNAVRVIEIQGVSKELCSGSHVSNTSDIDVVVVTGETGIAAGIRRIEGLSGATAVQYLMERLDIVTDLSEMLHTQTENILSVVKNMQNTLKENEKDLKVMRGKEAAAKAVHAAKNVREIAGVKVVSVRMDGMAMEDLRNVVDTIGLEIKNNGVVLVGGVYDGKANFACRVTPDLVGRFKAGALIKEVAKMAGGSGGGRDDAAQAGGKDVAQTDAALAKIYELVK